MTITKNEAFEAMLAHHRTLGDEVARRVGALRSAVAGQTPHEPAVAELVAYIADEVLPHALAEEHTLYQAASTRTELAATVAEMTDEHRQLAAQLEGLARTSDAPVAAGAAEEIGTLFAAHVAKENELLLLTLQADESVDLAQLLAQMQRLTEAAQHGSCIQDDAAALDVESVLLRLLLDAADGLGEAGHGERACRLVAQAWAALRVPRPDLAMRVTVALHRLVRSVTAEPLAFSSGTRAGEPGGDSALDVRYMAPAQRHDSIFAAYGTLHPGTGFVLVNDHDPKPLHYQFEAEHAGCFTWDVLEAGPAVWRVRIGRPAEGAR
ncbi:MAG TPA: DUF2249 domain-containing protein [Actinomycetota bacterium]|nr:DUF2249 domain-containing protein [Actinomycetota bacterium]